MGLIIAFLVSTAALVPDAAHVQPAPALAAQALPPRAETEAYIRRSAEEWARGEPEKMRSFLADDYVGVASNGEIRDKARQLALAAEPSPYPVTRVDYVRFYHHGTLVIAQGAETLTPADGGPDRKLVWTDTWLFRDGRWQVVASQDSLRPAEGHDEERAAILALRSDNNRAIATGDVEAIMRIVAADYVLVDGGGGIVRNADEMRRLWASEPQRCTRTPRRVEIGEIRGVLRAAETGEWRCDGSRPGEAFNGSYFAHWNKGREGWRVVADTYVGLQVREAAER